MAKKNSFGMSRSSKILLFLIIIISILVGLGTWTYLNTRRTVIYLYGGNYESGTLIGKDMFLSQEIDTATYNAMASTGGVSYCTANEIRTYIERGDKLVSDVVLYEPVLTNQFVSTGGTTVEAKLEDNMIAVEILSSNVLGLSGNEVTNGSRVNISSSFSVNEIKETDLIFQDLLVLDVVRDSNGAIQAIFVEINPQESLKLQHALVNERVSIAILKPGSYVPVGKQNIEYRKTYSVNSSADVIQNTNPTYSEAQPEQ